MDKTNRKFKARRSIGVSMRHQVDGIQTHCGYAFRPSYTFFSSIDRACDRFMAEKHGKTWHGGIFGDYVTVQAVSYEQI